MDIPGYDAWKLRGPDENAGPIMEACETCKGIGKLHGADGDCEDCNGTGEVESELDEPDGDYLRDLRDDA